MFSHLFLNPFIRDHNTNKTNHWMFKDLANMVVLIVKLIPDKWKMNKTWMLNYLNLIHGKCKTTNYFLALEFRKQFKYSCFRTIICWKLSVKTGLAKCLPKKMKNNKNECSMLNVHVNQKIFLLCQTHSKSEISNKRIRNTEFIR